MLPRVSTRAVVFRFVTFNVFVMFVDSEPSNMAEESGKRAAKERGRTERRRETVTGFSRFLYAMNLMLEAASSQSSSGSRAMRRFSSPFFGMGSYPANVEEEFRKLLSVHAEDAPAAKALNEAFDGLVSKGLIKPVERSVRITKKGRAELQRLSEIVDSVYDQLIDTLGGRDQEELLELMKKIGSA
jgi:hypothetical protein